MTDTQRTRRTFLKQAGLGAACAAVAAAKAPAKPPAMPRKIVLLAGKPSHGRDTHSWDADARLLKACLETSPDVENVAVEIHVNGWPEDANTLEDADTIVLLSDGFKNHPFFALPERAKTIDRLMRRGVGLACIHYAVAALPPNEEALLGWIGGIYKDGYSKNPVNKAEASPAEGKHPLCRGWQPFTTTDEYYFRIWFGEGPAKARPVMTANLPPNQPERHTIAWAVERDDGGRGFGFTGGHFHKNWRIDDFRTMVLNAILWTAKMDVPAGGVRSKVPDRDFLKPKPKG